MEPAAPANPENYWPERLFALLLTGLVTLLMLHVFSVRTGIVGATDFKTIYASAWNLRHAADAYRFENITAVLTANGVTPPPTAYGHNAVYPPFSLALLAPMTWIPLVPAIWLWCIAGCIAISAALAALAKAAAQDFAMGRGGRFLLILLGVLYPVFTYATITQNVSLMASSLALLAVAARDRVWPRSLALAVALLLKPHVALWPALALFLLPNPKQHDRRVVVRAFLLCAAAGLATCLWMALDHQLVSQLHSYAAALRNEVGGGSMSPTRRDIMAAGLQITSLSSLIGFWQSNPLLLSILSWTSLTAIAAILLWSTWQIGHLPENLLNRAKFVVIAAWCSFGMIATYHRAHDALILIVLLPWLIANCKPAPLWRVPLLPWSMLGVLMLLAAIIVPAGSVDASESLEPWKRLVVYRQAPLCAVTLTILLALQMVLLARTPAKKHIQIQMGIDA